MNVLIESPLGKRFRQQALCSGPPFCIAMVCPQCKEAGLPCVRFHDDYPGDRPGGVVLGWTTPCAFLEDFDRKFFHSCEDHGGVPIGELFANMEELLVFVKFGS